MKRTLGQCLEQYRTDLGWDQTQASGETGFLVSQQQIGKIESGKIKSPGYLHVTMLLKAYRKRPGDLEKDMDGEVTTSSAVTVTETIENNIPLIDIQQVPLFIKGETVDILGTVPVTTSKSKKVFALKMTNDLMDATTGITYPKNAIVIFDATKPYVDHKDMLIVHNEQVLFRRIFNDAGTFYIKPLNTNYQSVQSDKPVLALARSVECRMIIK